MRTEKRLWIYSGLAIPPGVGVVTKKITDGPKKYKKVLLVGNEHARKLVVFFSQLAMLDNIGFRAEIKFESSPESWLKDKYLQIVLDANKPTVVIMSFGVEDNDRIRELVKILKEKGTEAILVIPSKDDSVKYFASLASKIWNNQVRTK